MSAYQPKPYHRTADETVQCPECKKFDSPDAEFCGQCGFRLTGATVGGEENYHPKPYSRESDEDVQCPHCQRFNDDDSAYCDQCGTKMEGRDDVKVAEGRARVSVAELRSAIAIHHTATDNGSWDGPEAEKNLPADDEASYRKAFAWVDPKGDPDTKTAYKFIHHEVSSAGTVGAANETACSAGIGVLNGGRGGTTIPAADRQGVYAHLAAHLKDAGKEAPELNSAADRLGMAIRSSFLPGSLELRAAAPDGPATVLAGHFSKYDVWYRVSSLWEGDFMERVRKGAFDNTITQHRSQMKVLFNHGFDPTIGDKPLGPIRELDGTGEGAYYEVPLLDTDYNREQVLPLLEGRLMDGSRAGSMLGASMSFQVLDDDWDMKPRATRDNPDSLPRRSVNEARVFEFGPVTFPASGAATAGVRSGTDEFIEHLLHDPAFVAGLAERSSPRVVRKMLAAASASRGAVASNDPSGRPETESSSERQAQLRRRAEIILKLGAI